MWRGGQAEREKGEEGQTCGKECLRRPDGEQPERLTNGEEGTECSGLPRS